MSARLNKDWLESFLECTQHSETPFKSLYWCGVGAIAGALQRRVWIDQGRYQLYPNFYIILDADAGVIQKSTTINEALWFLRKVEGINFGPKSCTWEALIVRMQDIHVSDTNFNEDNFQDQVQTKVSTITVSAPELSVFLDLENKQMVSALIELWDCPEDFEKTTKTSGSEFLEKPCVNLMGGTTPSWMRESFSRWSKEGGLASRFIFICDKHKRQLVAHPQDFINERTHSLRRSLTHDIQRMGMLKGCYKLHPEMMKLSRAWYEDYHTKRAKSNATQTSGFKDRIQTHVLKLCMVIAASRRDELIILPEDFTTAVQKAYEAEVDFAVAFEVVDERPELRPYNDLANFIRLKGPVSLKTIYSEHSKRYLLREIKQALEMMSNAGEINSDVGADGQHTYSWGR